MISSDIRINGALIAHVHAKNISNATGRGMARYAWTYHDIESGKVEHGEVIHIRADGAAFLIAEILLDRTKKGQRRAS